MTTTARPADAMQRSLVAADDKKAFRQLTGPHRRELASALQRARATIDTGLPPPTLHRPSGDLADLIDRYVRAWHAANIPALVALLRTDARMAMPPTPS